MATPEPEVDDVTNGEEEENFQAGMRQNAADFQAHDTDQDGKLDFNEFCALVREREMAEFSEEELRARFVALDADGSGQVDVSEYIRFSFRDALARSSTRAIDLFRQWVEGGSGEIEKKEFRRAIKSMGFDFIANDKEIDMIFHEFDTDGSGKVDYKELNKHLRQGAGSKIDPLLFAGAAGEIGTKSENRHKNKFSGAGGGGPPKTKLVGSARPKAPSTPKLTTQDLIVEDLYKTLSRNAPRLEQLFKRWDTDGDGLVSRKEWAAALPMIGINTTAEMLDLLFDELDADGSGTLDIDELRSAVRGRAKRKPQATAPERVSPPRGFSKSASTGSSKPPTQEALVAARSQQPIKRAEQAPRELSEEDVVALSKKLYDALKGVDPDLRHFFTLFKSVDKDGSGRITFEELGILVRQKLGLREKHLSQTQLLALWKKLDIDATGFIDAGELSRFLRIGQKEMKPVPDISRTKRSSAPEEDGDDEGPSPPSAVKPSFGVSRNEDYNGAGSRENPFATMKLALEAAPLGLRVVGMTAADDWGNEASDRGVGQKPKHPSRMETALRSEFDEIGRTGGESLSSGTESAEEIAALEARRQAARAEAGAEAAKQRELVAAQTIQAGYRAMAARRSLAYKGTSRRWKFQKFHRRTFKTGSGGSSRNGARFYVEKHETLEIVAVEGNGRLLLDACAHDGEVVVKGAVVYDSSAHALLHPNAHKGLHFVPGKTRAIWTTPGEFDYVFFAEPLAQSPAAELTVLFRVEVSLTGFDLVSEPPLPPAARQALLKTQSPAKALLNITTSSSSDYVRRRLEQEQTSASRVGIEPSQVEVSKQFSGPFGAARLRALEVEEAQAKKATERDAAHLSHLDARTFGQLARTQTLPPDGQGLQASASVPAILPGAQSYYYSYAFPGQPGPNGPGWPQNAPAYYFPQIPGKALGHGSNPAFWGAVGVSAASGAAITPGMRGGLANAPVPFQGSGGVAPAPGRRPAGRRR
jgi:Ca2+-binding EF-hand superfamily protein